MIENIKTQVCIIGAGPSGLMASIFAARAGASTIVMETNTSLGRKLLLTGGKRCNLTHQIESAHLIHLYDKMGKFLSCCIYEYSPQYIRNFFAQIGLNTTVEEDGCVFPATYKAEDVKNVLIREVQRLKVKFFYDKPVREIVKVAGGFLIKTDKQQFLAEKIIIATGGISWPQTGSTGDGYRFAKNLGHSIVEPRASLVPLVTSEKWTKELAGTSISNVSISANLNRKRIVTHGAIVFTNNGLGGPAAQDMSRYMTDFLPAEEKPLGIALDLVPYLQQEEMEEQIIRFTNENPKKKLENALADFVPKRIASIICSFAGCDDDVPMGQLKKEIRQKIVRLIKALPLSVLRTRPIEEATVTRGGVNLAEINPKTMESKICPGLFFAGEVIDADGPCGGYNLQICWSTGALAGSCAAKK
ncbi:MAG: NAD(P)/FAD-dependent oxidoreductase [Sedimentisphaerales bacterium]|nr:NAD(P)/FAD-dependent oxidoreductase [Sedimentisphaerales bacterium]